MRMPRVPRAFAVAALSIAFACAVQAAAIHDGFFEMNDAKKSERVNIIAAPARPFPIPTPLDAKTTPLVDAQSYNDVVGILRADNSCSRFFGGPANAVEAFNRFARKLRKGPLEGEATILQMSGNYTNFENNVTGATYRIFDKATINSRGPFLLRVAMPQTIHLRIGRFPVHTRQARALVLLHELGHLMPGAGERWLLPNDGDSPVLSDRNTRRVERVCLKELLALDD